MPCCGEHRWVPVSSQNDLRRSIRAVVTADVIQDQRISINKDAGKQACTGVLTRCQKLCLMVMGLLACSALAEASAQRRSSWYYRAIFWAASAMLVTALHSQGSFSSIYSSIYLLFGFVPDSIVVPIGASGRTPLACTHRSEYCPSVVSRADTSAA